MRLNAGKKEIRSYLLGGLSSEVRADFEGRFLTDGEFYQDLLIAEDELIDQRVTGSLSEEELRGFNAHFLITAERHRKVQFSRIFRKYLDSRQASPGVIPPVKPYSLIYPALWRNPVPAFALGLVICIGVFAVSWVVYQRSSGQQQGPPTVVFALVSGLTRSGGTTQRMPAPPENSVVQIQLELARNDYSNYSAELFREHESLKTFDLVKETKEGRQIISITMPGRTLKPGDYQVKVSGISSSGQPEPFDRYSFRIVNQ